MELNFKVGDRVNIVTMMGPERYRVWPSTIIAIYKNGIYKVLPDNRKYDGYCYKFRPNGEMVNRTWKDWSYMKIEKREEG